MNEEERAELAHNLKTPLAIIAGYAELLVLRDDEETRKVASEQIVAAAQRLRDQIDTMLGFQDEADDSAVRPEASPKRPPSRVLIIDDDVFVRRLLRMTLPTEDFEIAEAGDGDIALAVVEAQRPELVLLDWCMPTVSGETVLAEVKALFPEVAVVVLTAAGEQRSRAEALGADGFLTKPFSPLELLRTIDQLLMTNAAGRAAPVG